MVRQSCGSKLGSHTRVALLESCNHSCTGRPGREASHGAQTPFKGGDLGLQYVLSYLRRKDSLVKGTNKT